MDRGKTYKLKLNPDETVVNHKANQGIWIQPVLEGITLFLKTEIHILSVLLNTALSLDAQVSAVTRSAFAQLKLVC